jgi:hypothetical protein
MTDNYTYFYILNSLSPKQNEELLIDFKALNEFDKMLNELPEISPGDEVLEKIFKLI